MRLYWELTVRGFQRQAAYRTAAISGAVTNTFFGFLRAYVFIALYQVRPEAGGYDLADALTFTFLTQGMAALVELWAWWPIALSVRSGHIATDLSRPLDYQLYWLAQDYGRAGVQFLLRSIPPFVVGAIAFGVRLPPHGWLWVAFLISLILAIGISFAWRFILNLSAFWLTDYRGVAGLAGLVALLLSGFIVPVAMFPAAVRPFIYLSPFAAFVAIPIDIYLEKASAIGIMGRLALQALWMTLGLLAGRVVLAAARQKLVIQGG